MKPRALPVRSGPRPWGTAELLPEAVRYRRWIVEATMPYLGPNPIVVGAGSGEHVQEWIQRGLQVTGTEETPESTELLAERLLGCGAVVRQLRLPVPEEETAQHSAVVAFNILEHCRDDRAVLASLNQLLSDGGRILVMVPAFELALSKYERSIGHLRRYRRRDLLELAEQSGLDVEDIRFFNSLGLVAWVLAVRILRMKPKYGPLMASWDFLIVPILRAVESRWVPPFGKEILLVARRSSPASRAKKDRVGD